MRAGARLGQRFGPYSRRNISSRGFDELNAQPIPVEGPPSGGQFPFVQALHEMIVKVWIFEERRCPVRGLKEDLSDSGRWFRSFANWPGSSFSQRISSAPQVTVSGSIGNCGGSPA